MTDMMDEIADNLERHYTLSRAKTIRAWAERQSKRVNVSEHELIADRERAMYYLDTPYFQDGAKKLWRKYRDLEDLTLKDVEVFNMRRNKK